MARVPGECVKNAFRDCNMLASAVAWRLPDGFTLTARHHYADGADIFASGRMLGGAMKYNASERIATNTSSPQMLVEFEGEQRRNRGRM